MKDTERARHPNAECQNIRHPAREGDSSEVGFWTVGGIVHTGIERWASREHEGREVGKEGVEDDFHASLPEKRPARRRWVRG